MGNVCIKGCQSVYKALCGSESQPPNNNQADNTKKDPKDPQPTQNTPPQSPKLAKDEAKNDVKVEAKQQVKVETKPSRKVSLVKQQSKHVKSVKKPHEMKRLLSAGLQADCVLKTKTGNLKDFYTLGKKLGNGQFGTTFLCIEKQTRKEYACKTIAKRKLVTDDDVVDVRREVEIMHHLSGHPNVVSIKEAYEDAVSVYLVMELCAGGELFDRIIDKGHYSEREAADLAKTIVGVIEACHSLGVIHRDLKPENFLFVDEEEDALMKAIDFGLSIFFKPGQVLTDVVGSPYYVAPEVLLKNYGPEADIWSAESEEDIFEEVLHGKLEFSIDPWPNISESAKELVKKMLVRDPKKRITAHEVLCHPWISIDGVAPDKPLGPAFLIHLTRFSAMNKLKKMALRVIATKLSEEEIAGLKQMFKMIDTDNSGYITFEELKDGLKCFGASLDESEIHDLMQAADIDNNGIIDYEEFVAATLHFNKVDKEDSLYAAFSYFDKDGSGYITVNEIQQSCKELGMDDAQIEEIIKEVDLNNVIATKLSEEEIAGLKQMFKMIDTDNSGYITFEELKDGLKCFGASLDESEIHDLMQAADIDNNGIIDYEEFVAATLHFNKVDKEDSLYAAFSYFDKDGSGYITVNEIQQSCKELGMDDAQVEEIIKEVDLNNDGLIDYNEFVAMMQKGSAVVGRRQLKNTFTIGRKESLLVC
ncbi:EF-hand domain pair, Serine/threonine-protein kinase Mps1 [Artemisia annua]|uniref:non-specific serine/threonine protein kinase n=1 Tax=Artemisia annua TaxID=35608 RepID=A0A2U1QL11_ARTAN|nr:EF-hand domain pair, Serine/threonine-protein kinase Mps1 [Artemisia annua]